MDPTSLAADSIASVAGFSTAVSRSTTAAHGEVVRDCVVIGAGPGGLGAAAMLQRRGLSPLVLERGAGAGERWHSRYDRLRINTSALTSFLPRSRFPLSYGRWPTRDQLLAYYRDYAHRFELEIRPWTTAVRIDRLDQHWHVLTNRGELLANTVVVATGKDGTPVIPQWAGRDGFRGELIHAARYRRPAPYVGQRVVVVGSGSSGLDIALDLLEGGAEAVKLAVRTPPHLVRRALGPIPADLFALSAHRLPRRVVDAAARAIRRLAIGDLAAHGLPLPADGFTSRVLERGMIPTIDPGPFVPAVRRGRIQILPALSGLYSRGVVLADGARVEADVVIAATGYSADLEPLVGHLGVLGPSGRPLVGGAQTSADAPDLYFIGFTDVLTGNLREMRLQAKAVARSAAEG